MTCAPREPKFVVVDPNPEIRELAERAGRAFIEGDAATTPC